MFHLSQFVHADVDHSPALAKTETQSLHSIEK